MPEPTIQDSVNQLMSDLPQPIKTFLLEKLSPIAQDIMKKHALHLDQGAALERDLTLVLLGAREPSALATNLKEEAHLDDATLSAVLTDVNEQVFMPLRDALREGGEETAPTPAGAIVHPPLPTSRPIATPPANLPGVIQPKAATPAAAAAPVVKPVTPAPAKPNAPLAAALKSAGALPMLEDHEEPHFDIKKPAVAPAPVAPPPAPAPAMRIIPTTAPAAPQAASKPAPVAPPAAAGPTAPPAKAYAVDPYREQPEEHEK